MAQRVYLVATSPELVTLLHEFLACDAWQEDDAWGRIRLLAGPHTRANVVARWLARGLDERAFQTAGRQAEHARLDCLRPYPIVAQGANEAVDAVRTLLALGDEAAIARRLEAQLRLLGDLWRPPVQSLLQNPLGTG